MVVVSKIDAHADGVATARMKRLNFPKPVADRAASKSVASDATKKGYFSN